MAEAVFIAGAHRLAKLADACRFEERHLIFDDLLYRNVLVRRARIAACQLRLGLGALGYAAATGDPSVRWITERIGRVLEA